MIWNNILSVVRLYLVEQMWSEEMERIKKSCKHYNFSCLQDFELFKKYPEPIHNPLYKRK